MEWHLKPNNTYNGKVNTPVIPYSTRYSIRILTWPRVSISHAPLNQVKGIIVIPGSHRLLSGGATNIRLTPFTIAHFLTLPLCVSQCFMCVCLCYIHTHIQRERVSEKLRRNAVVVCFEFLLLRSCAEVRYFSADFYCARWWFMVSSYFAFNFYYLAAWFTLLMLKSISTFSWSPVSFLILMFTLQVLHFKEKRKQLSGEMFTF